MKKKKKEDRKKKDKTPAAPVSRLRRLARWTVVGSLALFALLCTGGAWFARGPALYRARPPAVKAVDSTAAGDMMLGAFCARYFPERILRPEAIALAMAAGAAAVELHASQVPDPARIEELARGVAIERG